jgi:hypothetical protein
MASKVITDLMKLSRDVYTNKNLKFNEVDGNTALRRAILDSIGGEWSIYAYMDNKGKFFQVLSEVLALPVGAGLTEAFNGLVSVNNIGLTDKRVIKIKDPSLFKVCKVARGNNNIIRNKIYNKQITVTTEPYGVKIYAEWDEFISGQIDFAELVDRVRKSIANDTALRIAGLLASTFNASTNPLYNVAGTYAEATLDTLIARVKAKTGMKVAIYGTATALGKVSSAVIADSQKETYANLGNYGKYKGTQMIELPQAYLNGTETFALDDTLVYVLPVGMELIDVTYQGDPVVMEITDNNMRADQQIEFQIVYQIGITALATKFFGIYDLT